MNEQWIIGGEAAGYLPGWTCIYNGQTEVARVRPEYARLVRAAPTMLEALQAVRTALELSETAPNLLAVVRAAIAAATEEP